MNPIEKQTKELVEMLRSEEFIARCLGLGPKPAPVNTPEDRLAEKEVKK